MVFSSALNFIETRSHTANVPSSTQQPKPTPRFSKPNISTDAKNVTSITTVHTTTTATSDEHVTKREKDTDNDNESIDRSSGDYSETKKFWQSLEAGQSFDEAQSPQQASSIPVAKPRLSVVLPADIVEQVIESESSEKTSVSFVEENISQTSSSKISSEAQVERSETSSLKSDLRQDILRDDDSITGDYRLENESFPKSDRLDLDVKLEKSSIASDLDDTKNRGVEADISIESLDYDSGERSASLKYKVKEREDILDLEDDQPRRKSSSILHEENEEEEDEDEESRRNAASFYIGESKENIITKSATEKRSEYAFDNAGYETTKDSTHGEKQSIEADAQQIEQLAHDSETAKQSNQFLQDVEPVHSSSNIKETHLFLESERGTSILSDSSLGEEKCETESSEKVFSNQPIHDFVESERQIDSLEYDSSLSNAQSEQFESHVEIEEISSISSGKKSFAHVEPIVCFPDEQIIEESEHRVCIEKLDSFDSMPAAEPQHAAVIHSPIEDTKFASEIEYTAPIDTSVVPQDAIETVERESISDVLKSTETVLMDLSKEEIDISAQKSAPVQYSPIESAKQIIESQQAQEKASEKSLQQAADDLFLEEIGVIKRAPVQHSPIETIKNVSKTFIEYETEYSRTFSTAAGQESTATTITTTTTSFDPYAEQIDSDFTPKRAAVIHSPIETIKREIIEHKSINDQSDEFDFAPARALVQHSPIETVKQVVTEVSGKQKFGYTEDFEFVPKRAPVVHSPIETVKQEISPDLSEETKDDRIAKDESSSSTASSTNKLNVVHRKTTSSSTPSNQRWSVTDPDNYSSAGSVDNSRPCSSDVENLYVSYGISTSTEYQTAHDVPGSTEYHTALSTLDHSGKTISSEESMKSFDSESSGQLGSVEVSEASETLVPSTGEIDFFTDTQTRELDLEFDENEQRLSSLETFGEIVSDENVDFDSHQQSHMKRSIEMIFQPDVNNLQSIESLTSDASERKISDEENRFGSSAPDAQSILSMSLSSTSNVDTIVENVPDDLASSFGSSLIGSYETKSMLKDDITTSTSFDENYQTKPIENLTMTTTVVQSEDGNSSVNTQITTDLKKDDGDLLESSEATETTSRRCHRRNDSTSFLGNLDIAKLSMESTESSSSLDDEMVIHDVPEDEKRESGSDSDYDRYETEYSRSFKQPGVKRKKKSMAAKIAQKPEAEIERKKSVPCIETIVEDVIAEDLVEVEKIRVASQNMSNYSNIPDIMITDDPTKYVSDDDDDEPQKAEEKPKEPEVAPTVQKRTAQKPVEQVITKISDEQYAQLIEQQYKTKECEYEEDKPDSPTSDSFELIEQPDISDEFVIVEEVAKEADELMTEGKSVSIKQQKYVKKHDDEVEKIIVKSAPAATNEGSTILQGRQDLAFEFEESPSSGAGTESSGEDANGLESSRKWVEMQLAEQAQNLRYPYDVDRGVLEDIKEEDTDFEVGSSRISSFKDSYSSNDFEAAAARRYHSREHDDISMSSLQEFESLEQAISLENRKFHSGSHDSSNGSFPKHGAMRTAQADEISLSSLKDFEGLENACLEATLLEIKAKEEHALLLSRSDESNKSGKSDDGAKRVETTTIVTKAEPPKVSADGSSTQFSSQTIVTKITTTTTDRPKPIKPSDLDDDFSSSNLMEVSTDSLELGAKQPRQQSVHSKNTSQYGSSDSLEISRSGDVMTSSIDSIEVSKDGATARSSKSECDSIEQMGRGGEKRDSIDSIDLQYAAMTQSMQNTFVDLTSSVTTSGSQLTESKTIATVSGASSSGYGGGISKDISSDSLNINQSEPELLITSTESLDHTSSTFATYQNESDSQMTMSGSMTSCDSNTLVDTSYDTVYSISRDSTANFMPDDKFGTRMTSTVTTATVHRTTSSSSDVEKK